MPTVTTQEKWSPTEASKHMASARNVLYGDPYHMAGKCRHGSAMERMSCSGCAIRGYEPRGGWGDGFSVRDDGPNYAGWARIYVEGQRSIPEKWRNAFEAERNSDNVAYERALEISINTFGVKWA